jgi:2OG-Fe(II) oxygenase superfamily
MLQEHSLNKQNPFIRGYYINTGICDAIVNEARNPAIKFQPSNDSFRSFTGTYLEVLKDEIKTPYVISIMECIETYKKEFPFCYEEKNRWILRSGIKLQHYNPGDYYKNWHAENVGTEQYISRHLVFMTYLNDIKDGGGTEFFHQNLQVKPEKGLTLIWPADWTHVHRGIVSNTEEKFIITGWFVFDHTHSYTGQL